MQNFFAGSDKMSIVNRDYFIKSFTKDNFPRFNCPFCGEGIIEINEKFFIESITETSKVFNNITGEVEGMALKFACILRCNNKKCEEIMIIEGDGNIKNELIDELIEEEPADVACDYSQIIHVVYYNIKYMHPPINIIDVSKDIPSSIEATLKESFSLFWNHQSSAGNKIRNAIELLLDDKKIVKRKKSQKGKYYYLSLHDRLKEFKNIDSEMAKKLMSLKWLGNAGSHTFILNKDDLIDAYEILDYILYEFYVKENKRQKTNKMSKVLTKKYKKK